MTMTTTFEAVGGDMSLAERSTRLRLELKEWEKSFAATNEGRKAGREDIKKDPTIAFKYKEYARLRDALSGKAPDTTTRPSTSASHESRSKKRKAPDTSQNPRLSEQTPKKHQRDTPTPSKSQHPSAIDPYDSPATVRKLQFTPTRRTVVGPTPQKDGKILGLFDLLSDNENDETGGLQSNATPSKQAHLQATPCKATPSKSAQCTPFRHSRTPASSNKRFLFAEFASPLKGKQSPPEHGQGPHSSTPTFLRRRGTASTLPPPATTLDDDGNPTFASPVARRPARPVMKGLSSILAGLRKMEDERLDDEMDVLREIEGNGGPSPGKSEAKSRTLVQDSQAGHLGPPERPAEGVDQPEARNEADEEEVDRVGNTAATQEARPWKKKGQKRQTRRITLRPVRSKPPPPSTRKSVSNSSTALHNLLALDNSQSACNPSPSPSPSPSQDRPASAPNEPPDSLGTKFKEEPASSKSRDTKATQKQKASARGPRKKKSLGPQNFRRLKLGPGHGQRRFGGRRGRR